MNLLMTLRKIRACETEVAAQVLFEHYLMLERNKAFKLAIKACEDELTYDEDDPSRTFIEAIKRLNEND